MATRYKTAGFTLIETMVASSIALIMLLAVISSIIFCQHMFNTAMREAESSLALRSIRDRLLFHAGVGYGGLLSGIIYEKTTSVTVSNHYQNIQVSLQEDSQGNYLTSDVADNKWFRPSDFRLVVTNGWSSIVNLPYVHLKLLDPKTGSVMGTDEIRLPQELISHGSL